MCFMCLACRVCDEQQHWKELTYLYITYDEYDNALATMIAHSPTAWEHVQFKDVAVKVSASEVSDRPTSRCGLTSRPASCLCP